MGERYRVLNHSHGRYAISPFDRIFHEGTLWVVHSKLLLFILHGSILVHFYCHGGVFYNRYLAIYYRTKYIDMDGKGVGPGKVSMKRYRDKMMKIGNNKINISTCWLYKR